MGGKDPDQTSLQTCELIFASRVSTACTATATTTPVEGFADGLEEQPAPQLENVCSQVQPLLNGFLKEIHEQVCTATASLQEQLAERCGALRTETISRLEVCEAEFKRSVPPSAAVEMELREMLRLMQLLMAGSEQLNVEIATHRSAESLLSARVAGLEQRLGVAALAEASDLGNEAAVPLLSGDLRENLEKLVQKINSSDVSDALQGKLPPAEQLLSTTSEPLPGSHRTVAPPPAANCVVHLSQSITAPAVVQPASPILVGSPLFSNSPNPFLYGKDDVSVQILRDRVREALASSAPAAGGPSIASPRRSVSHQPTNVPPSPRRSVSHQPTNVPPSCQAVFTPSQRTSFGRTSQAPMALPTSGLPSPSVGGSRFLSGARTPEIRPGLVASIGPVSMRASFGKQRGAMGCSTSVPSAIVRQASGDMAQAEMQVQPTGVLSPVINRRFSPKPAVASAQPQSHRRSAPWGSSATTAAASSVTTPGRTEVKLGGSAATPSGPLSGPPRQA